MLTVIIPTDRFPTYHQPPPNKREMKKMVREPVRTAQNQISVRVRPNGTNFAKRFGSSSHKICSRTELNHGMPMEKYYIVTRVEEEETEDL